MKQEVRDATAKIAERAKVNTEEVKCKARNICGMLTKVINDAPPAARQK